MTQATERAIFTPAPASENRFGCGSRFDGFFDRPVPWGRAAECIIRHRAEMRTIISRHVAECTAGKPLERQTWAT